MFERFTERARMVIVLAQEEARMLKHPRIGTEHILLGVLRENEGIGAWALQSLDITHERVRARVIEIVGPGEEGAPSQVPFTPRAKKVLEFSLREALSLGHNYIGSEHVLLGLLRDAEGVAARILRDLGEDSRRVGDEVLRRMSSATAPPPAEAAAAKGAADDPPQHKAAPARVLQAGDAHWRPSNQMGVLNCDVGKQLDADPLAARMWLLGPGQASTRHRHVVQTELYIVLEGTGRMRIEDDAPLTLAPRSSVVVEPGTVRQLFNDTAADALWLVVGTPPEPANTLEMTPEQLARLYPDGPQALPPELSDG